MICDTVDVYSEAVPAREALSTLLRQVRALQQLTRDPGLWDEQAMIERLILARLDALAESE